MIATDMDGTLLNSIGGINQRTVDTLHHVQKKGIRVVLCTGRFPQHGYLVAKDAGLDCPVISLNGCVLWLAQGDCTLADHLMNAEAAYEVHNILEKYGVLYDVYGQKHIVHNDDKNPHPAFVRFGSRITDEYGLRFSNGQEQMHQAKKSPVNRFFAYGFYNHKAKEQARRKIEQIPHVYVTSSTSTTFEVMPEGISKATGLSEMVQIMGIDMENIMAFGDYENDIPMLRVAGIGVAMGNAKDNVKKAADYVTDTNENDGLAKAVEKLLL